MNWAIPGVRKRSSRYARRFGSVFHTPIASKRLLMVLVLSSAARMPLPGATRAPAVSARSPIAAFRIARLGRRLGPPTAREEQSDPGDDQEDRPEPAEGEIEQEDQGQGNERETAHELTHGLAAPAGSQARVTAL